MSDSSQSIPHCLFLHGWGLSSVVWRETLQAWPEGRAHAVDLPGYGQAASVWPYSAEALADALVGDMAEPIDLVGWSMGGMVALALAARHPDKVRRLALVGSSPAFAVRAGWPDGMASDTLAGFARSLVEDYRATLQRFLSLQARGGDAARAVIARLREDLRRQVEPDAAVLAAGLDLLATVDLRAAAADVICPTLMLHGAYDTLCPPEAAAWLARQVPQGQLALHERAAHAPFLSHPAWFVTTLKEFLYG